MKILKKILSMFLVFIMIFSLIPVEFVRADEIDTENIVTEEESNQPGVQTEDDEDADVNNAADTDDVSGTKDTADTNEEVTPDSLDEDAAEEEAPISQDVEPELIIEDIQKVNFAVVEKVVISTPDTQKLAFSIGDEGDAISKATLFYKNVTTGESYEVSDSLIIDNTILFEMEHNDESQNGVYTVTEIRYTQQEKEHSIDLTKMENTLKYGVNTEVETNPDGVEASEDRNKDSALEDVEIVATDVEGNVISPNTISDAITNAEEQTGVKKFSTYSGTKAKKKMIVVLDPGHDNTHSGAQNSKLNIAEEKLNLKIAQYCKQELEKYSDVEVYMTRPDDGSCPYPGTTSGDDNSKRVEYAASVKADVYVSIHLNSSTNTNANGAEVYIPNQSWKPEIGTEGKELGNVILDKLELLGIHIRGVVIRDSETGSTYEDGSIADYYGVIKGCKLKGIPAIIVEHAFVSNEGDVNNYLNSDEKLQKLGIADATGIAEYYGLQKKNTSAIVNGIDYAAVFDFDYYLEHNRDIEKVCGRDFKKVLMHFVNYGMAEGRRGNEAFDVQYYKASYGDLRAVYKDDLKRYYIHYILYGKAEGRTGSQEASSNHTTEYNGVDYSTVYDYEYYTSHNADVVKALGTDDRTIFMHFINYGMAEGRQANSVFNVKIYKGRYFELEDKFGSDLKAYYLHYINIGKNAGYVVTEPVTKFNGTDYSAVYSFYTYSRKNRDVRNIYGQNDYATLAHFVNYGMAEGRNASENFEVKSYRNQYGDLRYNYKKKWQLYYMHYIRYGKAEGRIATSVDQIANPKIVYNGENYSAIYNFNYYCSKNGDLNKVFGDDDDAAIAHFVNYGMAEGRRASSGFDVKFYKDNNGDLRTAYGNNLKNYYYHYMRYGIKEGRAGVSDGVTNDFYLIMGKTSTSAAQMVRYYNQKASYPAFYKNSDAPTLEEFCKIYIEESAAEGVKAEVAFAQTMNETGFLKFGGDVSINQYNFAGLGAIGNGEKGLSFKNVREGIRAQIQHLKAYGSTDPLNNPCVDPRFNYVKRGSAIYMEWLGIQENPNGGGWAASPNYGFTLRNTYMNKLLMC